MADYRDVTEWDSQKADKAERGEWRNGDAPGLFDDAEARKRIAELISRAAIGKVRL